MLPRRLIGSCLAVVAAAVLMFGCGSSRDPVQVDLPPETVAGVNNQLDQIQERFNAGDCTGPNSATSRLDSVKTAVNSLEVDQQFIDDMNEMLDNLAERIDAQCEPAEEPTTTTDTTPETTDTLPPTTAPPLTDTTTTTTTDTTKSTTTTETTTTAPEPPTGPPGNPDNPNGNGPGGGVIPGGGNKKEKPKHTGKKDEGGKPKKDEDPNR